MSSSERTVILLPTYNEVQNIALILEEIFRVAPTVHVLVIDDNSPDKTAEAVERLQPRFPRLRLLERLRDRGFAKSYRDGFRQVLAEGQHDVLVTMDADFSHEPKELHGLLALLDAGADVAIGSRYAAGDTFPDIALWRQFLSRFANWYIRSILGLGLTDCTSGYLALRASALRRIEFDAIRSEGYGFLFELKYRFFHKGFRVAEHPVRWPNRHHGKSKMSKRIMWESFLLPWKIRFAKPLPVSGEVHEPSRQPDAR